MTNPFNLSIEFKPHEIDLEDYQNYFKRKKIDFVEDSLINLLLTSTSRDETYYAVLSLRELGTEKSIPALKQVTLSKSNDVQATSVLTIGQLANGSENEFLGQLLLNKNFRQKYYALWAIFVCLNNKAVESVKEFVIKSIKDINNISDSIPLALWYLDQYSEISGEIETKFAKVKDNIASLSPDIAAVLRNETKYFCK